MGENTIKLGPFVNGQNKIKKDIELDNSTAPKIINLNVSNEGILSTRDGLTRIYEGTNCHSLYKNLFVDDGILKLINVDNYTTQDLVSGLGNAPVSYVEINGVIYFSNKNMHGTIVNHTQYVPWKNTRTVKQSAKNNTQLMLELRNLIELPLGTNLCEFRGHLFVTDGNTLYFSDPLNYEFTRMSTNWFYFDSDIQVVASVENGLYVVTKSKTFFLEGEGPTKFSQKVILEHGAFAGDPIYVEATILDIELDTVIPIWFNKNGYVAGLPSGKVVEVNKGSISFSRNSRFSSFYNEVDGIRQIITSVANSDGSNYGATDKANITVIRNGVNI